jgi:hypothetical protein
MKLFLWLLLGFILLEGSLLILAHNSNEKVVRSYYAKKVGPNYYAKKLTDGNGNTSCYMGSDPVPCLFYDDIESPEVKRE